MNCPFCKREIPREVFGPAGTVRCPHCWKELEAFLFDPPKAEVRPQGLGSQGPEGSTPCANHPGNLAATLCDNCGTFICTLCETKVDDRTLCTVCFDRMRETGDVDVVASFRDYGALSATSSVVGCMIIYFAPILGPLALYWGYRGLKQKRELNEADGRVTIWLAIILATLQVGLLLFFVISMVVAFSS